MIIPFVVLGFWEDHRDMRRRHAILPMFSGQDLGISSKKVHYS